MDRYTDSTGQTPERPFAVRAVELYLPSLFFRASIQYYRYNIPSLSHLRTLLFSHSPLHFITLPLYKLLTYDHMR